MPPGAVAAIAAVLAIGVPTGLHHLGDRAGRVSSRHADALRWPVRGSLARDAGFLWGLRDDTLRRGAERTVPAIG